MVSAQSYSKQRRAHSPCLEPTANRHDRFTLINVSFLYWEYFGSYYKYTLVSTYSVFEFGMQNVTNI